jgi:hypothetical protein
MAKRPSWTQIIETLYTETDHLVYCDDSGKGNMVSIFRALVRMLYYTWNTLRVCLSVKGATRFIPGIRDQSSILHYSMITRLRSTRTTGRQF